MKSNKTVIITGANSGLGYQCAKNILTADDNWTVIIACRNKEKGRGAVESLMQETVKQHVHLLQLDVHFLQLDLASLQSVRLFVENFHNGNFPSLHALINNAGVQVMTELEYTADGFEKTFGTNHLGHFLLTNLLMDSFAEPARIIVVTSGTHDPATADGRHNHPVFSGAKRLAHPEGPKKMSGMQRYTTSKLCNILFTYELARKLNNRQITANAYDPAAVPATNLLKSIKNPLLRWLARNGTVIFKWMGMEVSTPEQSGAAMAHLLLNPKLENISGKYFKIYDEKKSSIFSYDLAAAKELWAQSVELVGLTK